MNNIDNIIKWLRIFLPPIDVFLKLVEVERDGKTEYSIGKVYELLSAAFCVAVVVFFAIVFPVLLAIGLMFILFIIFITGL